MKYIKKFENIKADTSISMNESEYELLVDLIMATITNPLGFVFESIPYDKLHIKRIESEKIPVKSYRLLFKFDFRAKEYSILYFLTNALLSKDLRDGQRVVPVSRKFLDTLDDTSIFIQVDENSSTTSMEGLNYVINKLIEILNDIDDNRICVGTSSHHVYPIFKIIILGYLKSLLKDRNGIDKEVYNTIKTYIGNVDNPHYIFKEMKEKNPFLYSKLQDTETDKSATMGDMGFND
jgi:hypothetical protein